MQQFKGSTTSWCQGQYHFDGTIQFLIQGMATNTTNTNDANASDANASKDDAESDQDATTTTRECAWDLVDNLTAIMDGYTSPPPCAGNGN